MARAQSVTATPRRPPLVGRGPELDLIVERLEAVRTTSAATMLLVRGDAGIGKSALLREASERARALGFTTVSSGSAPTRRTIPYAVFEDALAELDRAGDAPAELVAAFRAAIVLDDARPGGTASARLVRRGAYALLAEALRTRPVALVLDDLHAADGDSLALLSRLLTDLADQPLVVLAAARPATALDPIAPEHVVGRLAIDARGVVVDVAPLDAEEVATLLRASMGHPPDAPLIAEIHRHGLGNPFFTIATLEELAGTGRLVIADDLIQLLPAPGPDAPSTGHTGVLRRFFRDDGAEVRVARALAAFDHFRLDLLPLLAELTGLAGPEVTATVDALVARRLLAGSPRDGYRFAHDLPRTALYQSIGPVQRANLHAAIAARLRAGLATGADRTLELAAHVAASGHRDREAAGVFLAAARTTDPIAPIAAARWYALAAESLGADPPAFAEALAHRAHALFVGGRQASAAEAGLRALPLLPEGGLRTRTAGIVVDGLYAAGQLPEALRVIDEELARGAPEVPALAQRVHYLAQAGRASEAAAGHPAALASLGNASTGNRVLALTHLLHHEDQHGHPRESAAHLAAIKRDAGALPSARQVAVWENVALASAFAGRLADADDALRTAAALEEEHADTFDPGGARATASAYLGWLRGGWDAALADARRSVFDLEHSGSRLLLPALRAIEAAILAERGDHGRATRILEIPPGPIAPDPIPPGPIPPGTIASLRPLAALARAKVRRAAGDLTGAHRLLTAAAAEADAGLTVFREWILAELVDVLVRSGRPGEAAATAVALRRLAADSGTVTWRYVRARADALAENDRAAARVAVELAGELGLAFELARSQALAGTLGVRPRQHLDAAFHGFDALGAAPWRAAVERELRERGYPVPQPARAASAPTPTPTTTTPTTTISTTTTPTTTTPTGR